MEITFPTVAICQSNIYKYRCTFFLEFYLKNCTMSTVHTHKLNTIYRFYKLFLKLRRLRRSHSATALQREFIDFCLYILDSE